MPATLTAPAAPVQAPARRLRVVCETHHAGCDTLGILIFEGRKTDGYYVCNRYDDMAGEVTVIHEKDDTRRYVVTTDHTGRPLTCSGRQNNRCRTKDGRGCRHMMAVSALVKTGKLRTFSA